jgi:mRNA-degrading endonuclease RelE of RelBE toxin-antitoxin system
MPSKIDKFLSKLSKKQFDVVRGIINKIINSDTTGLQVKKLEGYDATFRLKKGDFRIIYTKNNSDVEIISVVRRSEKTYRDL